MRQFESFFVCSAALQRDGLRTRSARMPVAGVAGATSFCIGSFCFSGVLIDCRIFECVQSVDIRGRSGNVRQHLSVNV